ncbi:unnamed protein product [Parajaminaea phylloscopi]
MDPSVPPPDEVAYQGLGARHWPLKKKWATVLSALFFTWVTTLNVIGYPLLGDVIARDLKTTYLTVQAGNATYISALAIAPLILAPLSESHGRKTVFLVSVAIYTLSIIPQALAPNIGLILAFRFINGAASSVGASMAGGTVSDTFAPEDSALPMALFSLAVWWGQGIGPLLTTWTVATRGWRSVAWWNIGMGGMTFVLILFFMTETREQGGKAKDAVKGVRGKARAVGKAVKIPLVMLLKEPVVQSLALWSAFLWSVNYIFVQAIPIVFQQGYGWTSVEQSLVLLGAIPAGALGTLANWHQGTIYRRESLKAGYSRADVRLYYACVGGIVCPAAMFLFAWTGRPSISPAGPVVGYFLYSLALFPIYTTLFAYLGDVFGEQASSAMAAQSFFRNLLAALLPLVSQEIYTKLGSPLATTVLASVAAVMAAVPFVIRHFGNRLRRRGATTASLASTNDAAGEKAHHRGEGGAEDAESGPKP